MQTNIVVDIFHHHSHNWQILVLELWAKMLSANQIAVISQERSE